MENQEIEQLKREVQDLKKLIDQLIFSDRYIFGKHIQVQDGKIIYIGTVNGLKIGSSTSEKLNFFGGTPRVQYSPGGAATASGTYGGTEQNMIQNAYDCLRAFKLLA